LTDVSEELTASIIRTLMTEAVSSFETSVNIYQNMRRNIPEDSHLHTLRRENVTAHLASFSLVVKPRFLTYLQQPVLFKQLILLPNFFKKRFLMNI
jgi:hypothetical protein